MNFDDLLLQIEEDLNEFSEEEEIIEDVNLQNNTTSKHDEIKQSYLQTINQQCNYESFLYQLIQEYQLLLFVLV